MIEAHHHWEFKPGDAPGTAASWAEHKEALADWTLANLVTRHDVWGS
jgi:hypothetical protein